MATEAMDNWVVRDVRKPPGPLRPLETEPAFKLDPDTKEVLHMLGFAV